MVRPTALWLFESSPDRQTRRGQAGGTSGALLRRAHLHRCRDRIPVSPPELRESYKGITSRFQRDDRISSIRSRSNFLETTTLTMLDGKERRDCESRGFCSTQNVSTSHADQRPSLRAKRSNPRFRGRPLADLTAPRPLTPQVFETVATRRVLELRRRIIS